MVKTPLKLVLLSAVLLACPIANAQPGAYTDPNGNTNSGPGAGYPQGGGGRFNGGGGRHHHSPVPNREQVMSLASLTPQQRQDLDGIYRQAQQTMRPLMMQLRQMGGPGPNAGGGGAPGSADSTAGGATENPQRAELMHQIHEERRNVWESVKTKLTPDQVSQLEQQAASQPPRQFPPSD